MRIMIISTLAPREGSDHMYIHARHGGPFLPSLPARGATVFLAAQSWPRADFYPRSPRGERRPAARPVCERLHFYPRSPRGERPAGNRRSTRWRYFYPRSPRGERPCANTPTAPSTNFYPRSPRGERPLCAITESPYDVFLPSLPARGATVRGRLCPVDIIISPLAPREGSDRH